MCITDERGLFVDVNDEYCGIYGYAREELIGQSFTMMVGPTERRMMQELHDDFIKGIAEPPTEFNVVDKTGRMLTLAVKARLLVQPDGTRYKVTSVRDITTAKLNEEHLEVLSRNLLVAIFRYKLHADGRDELMYLSEGAREIWGLDPERCMRDTNRVWALYHPEGFGPGVSRPSPSRRSIWIS